MTERKAAVLFFENANIRQSYLYQIARSAKAKGFAPLLVRDPKTDPHSSEIFQEVAITRSWHFAALEKQFDLFSKRFHITALIEGVRLFSSDGLVAAEVARLAAKKGLCHHSPEALVRANNKYLMRESLRHADVPTVDFGQASDLSEVATHAERIGYPVILKPLTGAGSNLIFKCHNEEELRRNFQTALERLPHVHYKEFYKHPHSFPLAGGEERFFDPTLSLLVEKYIAGRELSVECIATEREVFPLLVHEKLQVREKEGFVLEDLLVIPPVTFSPDQIAQIKRYAARAVKALGLKNIFIHAELRWEEGRGPQMLEINPRIGGGQVVKSFQTFLHLDPYAAELELLWGTFDPARYKLQTSELHAMFFFFPPHAGLLRSVEGLEAIRNLPGVIAVEQSYPDGNLIYGNEEECFLVQCWMKGESEEQIRETYRKAWQRIKINV